MFLWTIYIVGVSAMERKKELKAGGLYLFGNIFDKAITFITVPIFTRLLSTADYGVITTYFSWVSIFSVIITLSLGESVRTAMIDFKYDKDGYISSIFGLGSLSAIIITLILCLSSELIGFGYSTKLVLLCCVHSYAVSIIVTIQWRYVMELCYLKRALVQSLPNLIIIILSAILIPIFDTERYLGRIYPNVVVLGIIALIYVEIYFWKKKKVINLSYWKYALAFSIPIIFHTLSSVILAQADRTMISLFRNDGETGIYGLAYQFGNIPLVVTTTCENLWLPWFTNKMIENDKKSINKMSVYYINFVALVCAEIILISPEILKIMTIKEYYSAIYIIGPIVTSTYFMFLATLSVDLEYYTKRTKSIAINTTFVAGVNILLNIFFIPRYGAVAAAYTTLVSYIVLFVLHYCNSKKIEEELFETKMYIIPIVFMITVMVGTNYLMNLWPVRWGIAVVLVGLFFIYALKSLKIKRKNGSK